MAIYFNGGNRLLLIVKVNAAAAKEIKMKKKRMSFWGMLVCTALAFGGCATLHTPVFDAEITAEQGATVYFSGSLTVLTVNGIDVKKEWYKTSMFSEVPVQVVLPAGKTDIVFDLKTSEPNGVIRDSLFRPRYSVDS